MKKKTAKLNVANHDNGVVTYGILVEEKAIHKKEIKNPR